MGKTKMDIESQKNKVDCSLRSQPCIPRLKPLGFTATPINNMWIIRRIDILGCADYYSFQYSIWVGGVFDGSLVNSYLEAASKCEELRRNISEFIRSIEVIYLGDVPEHDLTLTTHA
jgi:hypothetical protein